MAKMKKWNELPEYMQNEAVQVYYNILKKRSVSLFWKRVFDIFVAALLLVLSSPVFAVLAVWIKADSKGPVFFRQERITQFGRSFRIFKFRTMVQNAERLGSQVTVSNDVRITKVGRAIRKLRLDELPQLLNVLKGDMSFVGTRPEVKKYVDAYTEEMYATLLLPAGITSEASICYKDEERLLESAENADETYIDVILPEKMKYNLEAIRKFSILSDVGIMLKTLAAVLR